MIDLEKTISGLNEIADYFRKCRLNASFGSKAEEHFWDLQIAAMNAAEMLMKQEPVKPTPHMFPVGMYDAMATEYLCGNCGCGLTLNDRWRMKYCPECGKAVRWYEKTDNQAP